MLAIKQDFGKSPDDDDNLTSCRLWSGPQSSREGKECGVTTGRVQHSEEQVERWILWGRVSESSERHWPYLWSQPRERDWSSSKQVPCLDHLIQQGYKRSESKVEYARGRTLVWIALSAWGSAEELILTKENLNNRKVLFEPTGQSRFSPQEEVDGIRASEARRQRFPSLALRTAVVVVGLGFSIRLNNRGRW